MSNSESELELSEPEFLRLLVKHEASLRAYARAIVPDWELVDEAVQETSITLWQKRAQLQELDGFVPWAKTVLRFKCLGQLDKLRAQRHLLSDSMLEILAARAEQRKTERFTPQAKALHVCLGQFSDEHRELLLAPHSSTCKVVDLAEKRNKSPNSLYKLLARLRQQLIDCVDLRIAGEVQ